MPGKSRIESSWFLLRLCRGRRRRNADGTHHGNVLGNRFDLTGSRIGSIFTRVADWREIRGRGCARRSRRSRGGGTRPRRPRGGGTRRPFRLGFGERVVARIRRFRGFVDEFDRGGVYLGVPGTVEVRGGRGVRFRARGRGARRGDEEPGQVVHEAESGFGGGGVRREHVRVDDSDGF